MNQVPGDDFFKRDGTTDCNPFRVSCLRTDSGSVMTYQDRVNNS